MNLWYGFVETDDLDAVDGGTGDTLVLLVTEIVSSPEESRPSESCSASLGSPVSGTRYCSRSRRLKEAGSIVDRSSASESRSWHVVQLWTTDAEELESTGDSA